MILVTGGNGFLGRQIVRALAAQSRQIRLVLREGADSADLAGKHVVRTANLFAETEEWWVRALESVTCVVHAAWVTEPGKCLVSEENLACLSGTITLAKACRKAGVNRFVGIGTCFEYDHSQGLMTVETALRPTSLYAACKASAFMTLGALFELQKREFSWCRPFFLYGEGEDRRRLIPYIRERLSMGEVAELTAGDQIRDFLDVEDAGRMIADVAMSRMCGPVNICSGVPITVRQLAERIADEYGRRDLLRFGARQSNLVDPPCLIGKRIEVL